MKKFNINIPLNEEFKLEMALNRSKYELGANKIGTKVGIINIIVCLIINNIYYMINGTDMKILFFVIMQIILGYFVGIIVGIGYIKYEEFKFLRSKKKAKVDINFLLNIPKVDNKENE